MKKIISISVLLLVICFSSVAFGGTGIVKDKDNVIYEIVTIEKGDTVWSIAEAYRNEKMRIDDYVDYIMDFNQMTSDKILPNQKIIIPVFK